SSEVAPFARAPPGPHAPHHRWCSSCCLDELPSGTLSYHAASTVSPISLAETEFFVTDRARVCRQLSGASLVRALLHPRAWGGAQGGPNDQRHQCLPTDAEELVPDVRLVDPALFLEGRGTGGQRLRERNHRRWRCFAGRQVQILRPDSQAPPAVARVDGAALR